MRVCDFMVDRLGWSFVVCNVCNLGDAGQFREQQLVFRYDGERREIASAADLTSTISPSIWAGTEKPPYWLCEAVLKDEVMQKAIACEPEELVALQKMMDLTFKRVLTRDRVAEYQATFNEEMPYRLEVVHAFRSENSYLWHRLQERRQRYSHADEHSEEAQVKSLKAGGVVNSRLAPGEAYLFHGTNPSSSMSILKTGFTLSSAGKSTGTMFGYGIYLAECSSKSDEYARDDGGGSFPQLLAMLVCRSLVGKAFFVQDSGDYIARAQAAGCDCICGDREKRVGTYREFVFFEEEQVVPEYAVIYRREYNKEKLPPFLKHLKSFPTGTTGRSWQVRLDRGWANVAPEANRLMLLAYKRGETTVEVELGSPPTKYTFDIAKGVQRNQTTGKERPLRRPMVID